MALRPRPPAAAALQFLGVMDKPLEPQQLSLLDVPLAVLQGGLADMHPYPLVARSKQPGASFACRRVPASDAWRWDEVEYARTPTSYTALVVDLDGPNSRNRLLGAVCAKAVQMPSWIVERPSSGGVHVVWALSTPVHRYPHARRSPLDFLARIADFYNQELGGDPGYVGVLAHNPESSTYSTEYLGPGWSLEELGQFVPSGWKRSLRKDLETPIGRNVTLYRALQRFAGRGFHTGNRKTQAQLEYEIDQMNAKLAVPLPIDEIRDILASINRSMKMWAAQGHRSYFLERQGERGFLPEKGSIRRSADPSVTNEKARPWKAEGVSRRTWYYQRVRKPRPTIPLTQARPWDAERVSRATWYRHRTR